jgi:hypothetical protein
MKRIAPRGKSESPWSLHIGSFWKIHFINPPEVQGQLARLIYGWENVDAKVPRSPSWVNRKMQGNVPNF